MNDVIVRQRYSRYGRSASVRRRKRTSGEQYPLAGKIMLQSIICIVILALISMIKSVDTPLTNYMYEKIRTGISQNIELGTIYEKIDNIAARLTRSGSSNVDDQTGKGLDDDDIYSPDQEGTNAQGLDGVREPINSIGVIDYDISVETDKNLVKAIKDKYTLLMPVEGYLSSAFGYMTGPVDRLHTGIDIAAQKGAEVKASLDGEVIESGTARAYGNYIKIKHGDGLETLYAHCSQLMAKKGQKVKQGDTIARVGDTGISTGAHLHFEIVYKGKPINPLDFLDVPLK